MSPPVTISIRPIRGGEEEFLREMLYHALYVLAGSEPFPRGIVDNPEIGRYVQSWGRAGDEALIAVDDSDQRPVGAIWMRLWAGADRGYGYVGDDIPELSMAVLPEYRGKGIGSALLTRLLEDAEGRFACISLSVSTSNPAMGLYLRFGFESVAEAGDSVTAPADFLTAPAASVTAPAASLTAPAASLTMMKRLKLSKPQGEARN